MRDDEAQRPAICERLRCLRPVHDQSRSMRRRNADIGPGLVRQADGMRIGRANEILHHGSIKDMRVLSRGDTSSDTFQATRKWCEEPNDPVGESHSCIAKSKTGRLIPKNAASTPHPVFYRPTTSMGSTFTRHPHPPRRPQRWSGRYGQDHAGRTE